MSLNIWCIDISLIIHFQLYLSGNADDAILTARDIRLNSASSQNSMEDRMSLDTVSLNSSEGSRENTSPVDRRLTKSESFDRFRDRSNSSLRSYSVSELDEEAYNRDRKGSRQEVLKQMRLNKKKMRKERKEELEMIAKQKLRRKEIAEKVKQETIREEVKNGTYTQRLDNSLDILLGKFQKDDNDDMKAIRNAMQLLTTEEASAELLN